MTSATKRVGVLTGGGDAPGLNPAIKGLVDRGSELGLGGHRLARLIGTAGGFHAARTPVKTSSVVEVVPKVVVISISPCVASFAYRHRIPNSLNFWVANRS